MLLFALLLTACTDEAEPPPPAVDPAPDAPAPAVTAGDASDLPVPDGPAEGRPDIVLVVFDTLRADHLGLYGYSRKTSPALDALGQQGLVFTRAYAQSGWTLASFSSLLTGQYPHQHRVVRDSRDQSRFGCLVPEQVTVAEALKRAGYRTAAFVNNTFLAPEFGLQQGFDLYDYEGATNSKIRSASETVKTALGWLDGAPGDQPAFMMLHFMEPHLDYAPPESVQGSFADPAKRPEQLKSPDHNPWALMQMGKLQPTDETKAYAQALYDEEILAADRALGSLVRGLEERGRLGRTWIAVTADHGEEFWEHGGFEHGHALWGELTRVPLVLRPPSGEPRRIDTVVEHVDLVQGLLKVAHAPVPPLARGEDLLAVANQPGPRFSLQENCLYGPPCISLVSPTHRLSFDPSRGAGEVWEVNAEGFERVRLQGDAQVQQGNLLVNEINRRRGSLEALEAAAGPRVPSYNTFRQLQELGYVDEATVEAAKAKGETGQRGCGPG